MIRVTTCFGHVNGDLDVVTVGQSRTVDDSIEFSVGRSNPATLRGYNVFFSNGITENCVNCHGILYQISVGSPNDWVMKEQRWEDNSGINLDPPHLSRM